MLLVRADTKTTEIIEGSGSDEELLKDAANIADAVLGVLTDGEPQLRKRTVWETGKGLRKPIQREVQKKYAVDNKFVNEGIQKPERDRMQAIDELTDEGYEDLAQKAKNEGWTESAFLKELRKAKADRKKKFLKERKGETGAAEQVLGGSQEDQDGNAEEEMKKFRKEAKEMAEELTGASSGGMF